MYHSFNITRESPDNLSLQSWLFCMLDLDAVLDRYSLGTRPTKRHKFHTAKVYNRLSERDSTLKVAEVPVPDDVVAEVRQRVIDTIRVVVDHNR